MWGKLHRICKKFSKFAPNIQLKYVFIMARLIAETPVLSGSDARRFEEAISNVQPLSSERRAEMDAEYRSFTSKVIINI